MHECLRATAQGSPLAPAGITTSRFKKGRTRMTDIVDLIRADHARIRGLLTGLEDACRASPAEFRRAWEELAGLLEAHISAAEEIGYLPILACAANAPMRYTELTADHDDIREAVAEARLSPVGSRSWWLAVHAARTTAVRHIDALEATLLGQFLQHAPPQTRQVLAGQWQAFTAALALDASETPRPVD